MNNNPYFFNKSYIDWISYFLSKNNIIRLSDLNFIYSLSKDDFNKSNELFSFFNRLLTYCIIHNIKIDLLQDEIISEYKDTFTTFDSSIIFQYDNKTINIFVLEMGGSSDMIIRIIDAPSEILDTDIIDIDDFYNWLNDYENGNVNCLECSNLVVLSVDYKKSGIDYKCNIFNEFCYKEIGVLAKNEKRIYPCPTCRRTHNLKFNNI